VGAIFDAAGAYSDKESRQDLPAALSLLARLYRDALVTAAGAADLAILQDKSIEVESLAERARTSYDLLPLRRALRAVLEATLALASNVNPVTALEKMMMDLRTSLEGAR
jgi:hypothetical protein